MFSDVLQQLRKAAKLTQDDVADVLRVPKRTYGSWERNERQPDFETLCKIADYFEVSTDYLLGRTPMTVTLVQGDPPPKGEDEYELVLDPADLPKSPDDLDALIRAAVNDAVTEELKKRGL